MVFLVSILTDHERNFISHPISSSFSLPQQQYWRGSSINKNEGMVQHLQSFGIIKSKRVAEVMQTIDRGLFVPEGTTPYVDSPMQIGYNATISAPHMHAMCLELLESHLKPGMHALDVGSGKHLQCILSVLVVFFGWLVHFEEHNIVVPKIL